MTQSLLNQQSSSNASTTEPSAEQLLEALTDQVPKQLLPLASRKQRGDVSTPVAVEELFQN